MNHTLFFIAHISAVVSALSSSYLPKTGTPPPPQQFSSLAFDSKSNMLYIYGGVSIEDQSNIWKFDLEARKWSKLSNSSWMSPGPRTDSFITILEESREILLFGGISHDGPTSEVWTYEIEDEAVTST
jgi:hypothetical protein